MIADHWTLIDDSLDCLSSVPQQMGTGFYGNKQREHDMKWVLQHRKTAIDNGTQQAKI